MNDWYSLGVALRVHPNKLQEIQKSSPLEGIQRWKIDLLQHWLKSTTNASWSMIAMALEKIGHRVLADQLRAKYLVPQTAAGTLYNVHIQQWRLLYIVCVCQIKSVLVVS